MVTYTFKSENEAIVINIIKNTEKSYDCTAVTIDAFLVDLENHFLFDLNNDDTRERVVKHIEDNYRLTDVCTVFCDEYNNTEEVINNKQLVVELRFPEEDEE